MDGSMSGCKTTLTWVDTCPTHGTQRANGVCWQCLAEQVRPQNIWSYATWPVPPVCTGTGTLDVDYRPAVAGTPDHGRCGICGQRVRLYDGQHLVTHPYLLPGTTGYCAPETVFRSVPSPAPPQAESTPAQGDWCTACGKAHIKFGPDCPYPPRPSTPAPAQDPVCVCGCPQSYHALGECECNDPKCPCTTFRPAPAKAQDPVCVCGHHESEHDEIHGWRCGAYGCRRCDSFAPAPAKEKEKEDE